jgi:hypothetical protein
MRLAAFGLSLAAVVAASALAGVGAGLACVPALRWVERQARRDPFDWDGVGDG